MPEIKVIAVEPEDSACLKAALDAGEPVVLDQVSMFADGVAVKRIGDETFRLCQQYLDGHITVSSDEICAAVKDIFEDTRAIAEPSGALALAGLKKFAEQNGLKDKQLATVLSGANTNFHGLRYVSERCELGEKREGLLAVTIPERKGAFFEFCQIIGGRAVTEFNYRYSDDQLANIFVGVRLMGGQEELKTIIHELRQSGYPVQDLSDDEMAKLHIRYMIGGRPSKPLRERLYSFEFPEYPGALLKFLSTLVPTGISACSTTATTAPITAVCCVALNSVMTIWRASQRIWLNSVITIKMKLTTRPIVSSSPNKTQATHCGGLFFLSSQYPYYDYAFCA